MKPAKIPVDSGYAGLVADLSGLLDAARRASARAVNSVMTATYWEFGQRIVEFEQGGKKRAAYGEELLAQLATDLTAQFGRGFSQRNLRSFRIFYEEWPIRQTLSAESSPSRHEALKAAFPLPWSHYVRLMSVKDEPARHFYGAEALRGGWSVRQLDRQIGSLFFERTALSINKAAMLTKGAKPRADDRVTPDEEVKDPLVLEFLNLKDEYSESELEEALLLHLEHFLLELGSDFTFVGRQRRLRIGDVWYRVDLLFFHRRLRCLVVIDLKIGKLTHADAGQMHVYLNYAKKHWTNEGENPPVGLILCSETNDALAEYALDGLPNKVLAREYKSALPEPKLLAGEIEKTRERLEARPK
ncbi:MAG: DUF1016 family protein [Pedosphaera sp.]|nr:DUF1016 family protein [Pedosphaera sp.]